MVLISILVGLLFTVLVFIFGATYGQYLTEKYANTRVWLLKQAESRHDTIFTGQVRDFASKLDSEASQHLQRLQKTESAIKDQMRSEIETSQRLMKEWLVSMKQRVKDEDSETIQLLLQAYDTANILSNPTLPVDRKERAQEELIQAVLVHSHSGSPDLDDPPPFDPVLN